MFFIAVVSSDFANCSFSACNTTHYKSSLTWDYPMFHRPSTNGDYFYEQIKVTTAVAGNFMFLSESSINIYGLLYYPTFNATSPSSNLLAFDDESGGKGQFFFQYHLEANQQYYLVISTRQEYRIDKFIVHVRGPVSVNLTRLPCKYFCILPVLWHHFFAFHTQVSISH